MADPKIDPPFDPYAERNRVIRQRNIALGLVLLFFVVLFFAITVVKMRHVKLPHKSPTPPMAASANGQ
jgi:hypothetical protein